MEPLAQPRSVLHVLAAPEDVGAVRRVARALATELHASEADCGRVELAVTELGTNTLRHAKPPGYLMVQRLTPPHGRGLEVLAVDRGPGVTNLSSALRGEPAPWTGAAKAAGHGLGCGLSSVRRLASEFDVHTEVGKGTVVLARFLFEPPTRVPGFRWGTVSLPLAGEYENGDGWAVTPHAGGCTVLVADGLGHGPAAAVASAAAVAQLLRAPELSLESYLQDAHQALRGTRGAAVSICRIDAGSERVRFAGLGNVEGRIHLGESSVGLSPRNGTLGMNMQPPKFQVRELPWGPGAALILHSDGLRPHFDLCTASALLRCDPAVVAAVLHRDFSRGRDDTCIVVVQDTRGRAA